MKLIAHASKNWGIGKNNDLMFRLPLDMKFFRETTSGGIVIMGRKTLESFPNQKPLPHRINIVLSSKEQENTDNLIFVKSPEDALVAASKYADREIFVIGGGKIYDLFLPYIDTALITRVMEDADADTFLHDFDSDEDFVLSKQSEDINDNGHIIRFCEYTRK
ncbi:MAG: dihydrofolate reductase [Clostridia bacterium]|nr:dihydrofolate reductase [Clostridia bacterium]